MIKKKNFKLKNCYNKIQVTRMEEIMKYLYLKTREETKKILCKTKQLCFEEYNNWKRAG